MNCLFCNGENKIMPYRVNIVKNKHNLESVAANLNGVISCINGYTLKLLMEANIIYMNIVDSQNLFFVADGVSVEYYFKKIDLNIDRICGRDVLELVLNVNFGRRKCFVVLPSRIKNSNELRILTSYFGNNSDFFVAPWLDGFDECSTFAMELAEKIPSDAIVIMGIQSPKQDLISVLISKQRSDLLFLNVGAIVQDIKNGNNNLIKFFSFLRLEWLLRLVFTPKRTVPKLIKQLNLSKIPEKELNWIVV